MSENEMQKKSDWYRPAASEPSDNKTPPFSPSTPADASLYSTHTSPPRSAGTSPLYAYLKELEDEEAAQKAKKPKRTAPKVFLVCFVLVALIALSAVIFGQDEPQPTSNSGLDDFLRDYYSTTVTPSAEISIPRAELGGPEMALVSADAESELSLQAVYDKCVPSIVALSAQRNGSAYSWGTGIIMSADGYIITNTHIIDGCSSVTVTLYDDSQYEAKLVGADSISDLSLLKIEAEGLTPAEFGRSADLSVGDRVVAIGNPLGARFRGTMTDGIISAINRDVSYNGHSMTLLQTNAAINQGNSGGPLINLYGQVIGLTNMKMMTSSAYATIEGIGFAIPTGTIKTVVDQLMENGRVTGRPAIGITVGAIPSSAADYYELPSGLYVSAVTEGSDAQKKGVLVGDIITEANGSPLSTTADLGLVLESLSVGDSVTLTIYRSGESFDLSVTLSEMSDLY